MGRAEAVGLALTFFALGKATSPEWRRLVRWKLERMARGDPAKDASDAAKARARAVADG
jgi:hypothetical protein